MGTIRYIGEHTAEQIRRMPFGKALEALTEAEKLPSPHAPSQSQREVLLATTDIVTIESVFQHRDVAAGKYDSESHIRTLTNVLKALPADQRRLDPILVVPIDSSWICIDGHHRLEAYKKAGVSEVPAEVFTGGIRQAVIVAGEANSKTKLPMSGVSPASDVSDGDRGGTQGDAGRQAFGNARQSKFAANSVAAVPIASC